MGEWSWNSYTKDFLGTIKSIDKSAYYAIELDNQNGKTEKFCNLDMLVKPTKEEIEQHLVKIAEKKYPVGAKVKYEDGFYYDITFCYISWYRSILEYSFNRAFYSLYLFRVFLYQVYH